jgi:hypothetical protein
MNRMKHGSLGPPPPRGCNTGRDRTHLCFARFPFCSGKQKSAVLGGTPTSRHIPQPNTRTLQQVLHAAHARVLRRRNGIALLQRGE